MLRVKRMTHASLSLARILVDDLVPQFPELDKSRQELPVILQVGRKKQEDGIARTGHHAIVWVFAAAEMRALTMTLTQEPSAAILSRITRVLSVDASSQMICSGR